MISTEDAYPKEDKCRHCGAHIGWIMAWEGEIVALGVCDNKECQDKDKEQSDVGS